MKNDYIKIHIPIYEFTIRMYMGKETIPQVAKEVHRLNNEIPVERTLQRLENASGYFASNTIWLESCDINTLVHELYHVVSAINETTGIDDEEASAYLIGWLMEHISNKLGITWENKNGI